MDHSSVSSSASSSAGAVDRAGGGVRRLSSSSGRRRRALESRRRREERQIALDQESSVAEASAAAAEIENLLEQFTSPKVGTTTLTTTFHHMTTPIEEEEDDDDDNDMDAHEDDDDNEQEDVFYSPDPVEWLRRGTKGPETPPKRSKTFHRADTPVMSNSSRKKKERSSKTRRTPSMKSRQLVGASKITTSTTATKGSHNDNDNYNDDEEEVPFNVQSPWMTQQQQQQQQPKPSLSMTPAASSKMILFRGGSSSSSSSSLHHLEFRRYHEAITSFVRAKRNVVDYRNHRQQYYLMEQQQSTAATSTAITTTAPTTTATTTILQKETKVDIEFLQAMYTIAAATASASDNHLTTTQCNYQNEEANFWYLLSSLRSLGLSALIWEDDAASHQQYGSAIQGHLLTLARNYVQQTPATVAKQLLLNPNNNSPLVLLRRQKIIHWLEHSVIVPPNAMKPVDEAASESFLKNNINNNNNNTSTSKDKQQQQYRNHLSEQGFVPIDKDSILLDKCLTLILAGRLKDAQKLARDSHAAWRAALWDGGTPHGYEWKDGVHNNDPQYYVSTGNPNRALWRRMTWKLAEKSSSSSSNETERAIAAILSSNVRSALDNPKLKTLEHGLYVLYRALQDRTCDELLHLHNQERRLLCDSAHQQLRQQRRQHGFPGLQLEQQESQQLAATADIALLDDASIVELVQSRPMQQEQQLLVSSKYNPVTEATTSVLIGKSAIVAYMMQQEQQQQQDFSNPTYLRFVTHFALYLDSLQASDTPVSLDGVSEWKNQVLLKYVQYLASQDDLWYMLVVYASLLPEDVILDTLPAQLCPLESPHEREKIVEQLREFSTAVGFDLQVIRRVVRLLLQQQEEDDDGMDVDEEEDEGFITRLDMRKMKSILWLIIEEDHVADALIAANMLLRQFLLAENHKKLSAAALFIQEVLPDNLFDRVMAHRSELEAHGHDDMDTIILLSQIDHAHADHLAFRSYLTGMESFDRWKEVSVSLSPVEKREDEETADSSPGKIQVDKTKLNPGELSIAASMERRQLIDEKRRAAAKMVHEADMAERALLAILKHDGGWLLTDDEVVAGQDQEEMIRRQELQDLRCRILPQVVMLYENVCTTTAEWMATSLDDAVERLGCSSRDDVIHLIDNSALTLGLQVNNDDDDDDDGNGNSTSKRSSPISPRYWTRKVLNLGPICASDTYGIRSAFAVHDYENLMKSLAEAAVADMMHL